MRISLKAAISAALLGLAGLAGGANAAQTASPETYDCQARITRAGHVPDPKPNEAYPWKCMRPPSGAQESQALHWVRDSLEYCQIAMSVYGKALLAARREAANYGRNGWIVFMDADETVLDNSLYQREREDCGLKFTTQTWTKWVRSGLARDVPGAAAFTQTVHALGGLVAIVSNRDAADDRYTRKNLTRAGIVFDYEIGLTAGQPSNKAARWRAAVAALAARTHSHPKPVIWVGDQVSDLPVLDAHGNIVDAMIEKDPGVGIGERYFLIPNPVYGGWSSNPAR